MLQQMVIIVQPGHIRWQEGADVLLGLPEPAVMRHECLWQFCQRYGPVQARHELLQRRAKIETVGAGAKKPGPVRRILHGVGKRQQFSVVVVQGGKELGNANTDQTRGA